MSLTVDTEAIQEAINYDGPDKVVHFTEYLAAKSNVKRNRTFQSRFEAFDRKIGFLETGRVVVISGYAKNGKTLFAESWIKSILDKDKTARAGIFSFEIEPDKLLEKYGDNKEAAVYLPLQLEHMNYEWLYKRCVEARYKYDCRIVLLDHLHFLIDMATKQNMSLNIGAFMRRLKFDIAMNLGMAVLLIAHQEKGKDGEEASMRGARDSSFIGQECDAFIVVTRRKNFTPVDFKDIEIKRGAYYAETLQADLRIHSDAAAHDEQDNYSQGLAVVKVECSRMSGAFGSKTLFRRTGGFLEEV